MLVAAECDAGNAEASRIARHVTDVLERRNDFAGVAALDDTIGGAAGKDQQGGRQAAATVKTQ